MARVSAIGMALAILLGFSTSTALAAPKGKKASTSESKSVDDMMGEKAKPKKDEADEKPAEDKKEEEEVAEPDAWEKPPAEEEKAPPPPPKAETAPKVGDDRNFEAGLLLGWGFATDKAFSTDPYSLGFGLRLGYELDFNLFLGAGFEYFLGTSGTATTSAGVATSSTTVDSSASYMFGHIEAGYDIWIAGEWILRPSLWLGLGVSSQEPYTRQKHMTDFFFGPGVSAIYTMEAFFLGGDFRMLKVTGNGSSAITLLATGGLRL
jgi:hypothetical protein